MSGSDRDSLVFLYEEFAGDRWVKAINWCSELPCSRWFGVEMAAGHCTALKVRRPPAHRSTDANPPPDS